MHQSQETQRSPQSLIAVEHGVFTSRLGKRFGGTWALREVSLAIPPGSVVSVIGANGSGKTTLLRLLATALRPTTGRASVYGYELEDADRVRGLTVLVASTPGAYDRLTARENLRFAASMSGASDDVVSPALAAVGLSAVADRFVRTFSQGMRRRLALAQARVRDPRLLLLDEPFNGLDADGVVVAKTLIHDVKSKEGVVIVATHDWERAIPLSDLVVRLAHGRQVDPEERTKVAIDGRVAAPAGR